MPVNQVYVESGSQIAREMYLSLVLNRETRPDSLHRLGGRRHGHRGGRRSFAGEDHHRQHSSGRGTAGLSMPAARIRPRIRSAQLEEFARSRRRCTGCTSRRMRAWSKSIRSSSPATGARRARCQDQHRCECAVSPSGDRGAARSEPGRSDGARGERARPQLRLAGRQHRLHGERRRARDGDDGPDQAARRCAGKLSRRGRWSNQRARHRRVQADSLQCEGARDPGEYLRRHRALRPDRRRHHQRGQAGGRQDSSRGAAGRHERGRGARASRCERARHHDGERSDRRGNQGRAARAPVRTEAADEHSRQQENQGDLPGLHGQAGHLPFRAVHRVRHSPGRWSDAWSRWPDASRSAGIQHGARGRRRNGCRSEHDLRAGAARSRCHTRGRRRRNTS